MNKDFENISRIHVCPSNNPLDGIVRLDWAKVAFLGVMLTGTIWAILFEFSWLGVTVFVVKTFIVLLFGHSVGMHRLLIHRSFQSPKWLERILVHFGVLVGLGGPMTMIRTHDMRDWAQRQPNCHPFFAHRRFFLIDAYWQLFCSITLKSAPTIRLEKEVAEDPWHQVMEQSYLWAQLPWFLLFWSWGGLSMALWGVCAQVIASVFGHWLIGYFAHGEEPDHWRVEGAGVQGQNVPFVALLTMGECWHNNHHAFPGSARIGLEPDQWDPGWWVLKGLAEIGLVWNIRLAEDLAYRKELRWVGFDHLRYLQNAQASNQA